MWQRHNLNLARFLEVFLLMFMLPYNYLLSLACIHLDEVRICQSCTSGIFPQNIPFLLGIFGIFPLLWEAGQALRTYPVSFSRCPRGWNSWNWDFFSKFSVNRTRILQFIICNFPHPPPFGFMGLA